jgi:hypothetical protein
VGAADAGGGLDDEDGGAEPGDVAGVGVAVSGVFRVGWGSGMGRPTSGRCARGGRGVDGRWVEQDTTEIGGWR